MGQCTLLCKSPMARSTFEGENVTAWIWKYRVFNWVQMSNFDILVGVVLVVIASW